MTERKLVMVAIVKNIHQIGVEGVYVVQFGKPVNDALKLFCDGSLHKLDFTHVKLADSLNFETS